MALQIAKNIYPVGIHCPTWALRADDPSRRRKVRPPRIAVPSWLLSLRAGALSVGQDGLDRCSDTPRSWARWLLLGQAAAFAAAGDFTSVGAWAQAWSDASRPERPGPCARHPGDSESANKPLGQLPAVVEQRRDRTHAVARVGAAKPDRLFPCIWRSMGESSTRKGNRGRNLAETVNTVNQKFPFLKNFMAGPWGLLTPGKSYTRVTFIHQCHCRCSKRRWQRR